MTCLLPASRTSSVIDRITGHRALDLFDLLGDLSDNLLLVIDATCRC